MKILTIKVLMCWVFALWTVALRAETDTKPNTNMNIDMGTHISSNTDKKLAVTEQDVIALFYQRNLSLIAASFNIDSAQADQIIAGAIPNPVLSMTISSLSPKMFQSQYKGMTTLPALSPQIQQLIETAGKRRLRVESSELATEAVTFDLKDTARVLTNTVRKTYYDLLLAQKTAEIATDNFERYRKIINASTDRLKSGDIAATDLTRLEVESLKAQGDQNMAQTALSQARADLLLLLAWPENSLGISAVEAWSSAPAKITQESQDQLSKQALERRPDLQAARIRIDQAKKMLILANRLAIPDVTVGVFYQQDPGNFFTYSGGVSLSVPLPVFYRQEGEISKAHVGVSTAELTLKQTEQGVQTDVMKALVAWQSADAIAKRFESEVLQRIESLRKAQEFAYEKGAIGLLDLIDAERSYKAMMLDYYTSLSNRSKAWADLLMAYGEEVK
jgi:cobalt-zinc-cadmium efflux system outer membrane protein